MIDLRDNEQDINTIIEPKSSLNDITDQIKSIEASKEALNNKIKELNIQLNIERKRITFNIGDMFTINYDDKDEENIVITSKYTSTENKMYTNEQIEVVHVSYICSHNTASDITMLIKTNTETSLQSKIKKFNGNINIYKILNLTKE